MKLSEVAPKYRKNVKAAIDEAKVIFVEPGDQSLRCSNHLSCGRLENYYVYRLEIIPNILFHFYCSTACLTEAVYSEILYSKDIDYYERNKGW